MLTAYQTQARIFKALMHPARLAILDILRDGEQCVCHMEAFLSCRQAYISQHLAILRDAGLVQDRRDGWNIFYRVIKPDVYALIDATGDLAGEREWQRGAIVQQDVACLCPKCSESMSQRINASTIEAAELKLNDRIA